jgi:TonB family protein
MKVNFYFASFIACFLVINAFAQKKQNVYFLKDNGKYVNNSDSADFTRIVQEPDSGSVLYNVLDYYPNGNLKMLGKSSTIDPIKLEGMAVSYYPNKKKKQVASYQKGLFAGIVYDYYPNGKLYRSVEFEQVETNPNFLSAETIKNVFDSTGTVLVKDGNGHYPVFDDAYKEILEEGNIKNGKRDSVWKGYKNQKNIYSEEYSNGKFIKGNHTDENRNDIIYMVKEALPTFKGGESAFGQFLSRTVHYPVGAKERNAQGKVMLNFVVEKDGTLSEIKVLKSVDPDLDREALRAIRQSPKWNPGLKNGVPVRVNYTMPLSFTLSGG